MLNFSIKKPTFCLTGILLLLAFLNACKTENKYTRGVGVYPGEPSENFSPSFKTDNSTYRNLALHREAYHSSSYDYSLTAQLITDGIIESAEPNWVSLTTSKGPVIKNERGWLLDHNSATSYSIDTTDVWIEFGMHGAKPAPQVDRINISGTLNYDGQKKKGWIFTGYGSDDGMEWTIIGRQRGSDYPGTESSRGGRGGGFSMFRFGRGRGNFRSLDESITLKTPVDYRFYKVELSAPSLVSCNIYDFKMFLGDKELELNSSHAFSSSWMSAGNKNEWVYVDLGAICSFDSLSLHWIHKAASGNIQVSNDLKSWKDIAELHGSTGLTDEIKLSSQISGQYVRVNTVSSILGERVVLSELQVFGKGGPVPVPKPVPPLKENSTRMDLAGGNWKIRRASLVKDFGPSISQPGYDDTNWMIATVPGTALDSYLNDGALPDPNFGDNQLMISESFFCSDFWYRDEFEVPDDLHGQRYFLNFDGIDWKAEIYLNGAMVGRIEGAFMRGKFDVTTLLKPGRENSLAVLIIKNDNFGVVKEQTALSADKNGGMLGADNPTFHATVGWDWIPTIRGRDIGIWNDVYLTASGPVTIEDPFVSTDLPLPDTSYADINVEATLKNHSDYRVEGILKGKYGNIAFEQTVSLDPSETKLVKLNSATTPALHFNNPELWWPNGYGAQKLYDVSLSYETPDGTISDKKEFKSGVREMSYKDDNNVLTIYINGRRLIGRGGNWGFPESNLEYRGREYDAAVAYHADMHFTMIRNWVGQTGDKEFYDACDKYGIMIWQDFWLANPADGPDPNNPQMFLDNARDMIKKIRNHPSMALYVGRNEGNPPPVIDTALSKIIIPELHPGMYYISNSASGPVSGGGPYSALPPKQYFNMRGANKLHSERGMPNVMNYESLAQTLPQSRLWPQNSEWGMHDYCLESAQRAATFNAMVEKAFGNANSARQFTEWAQRINYDGYRAIFEGRSRYRKGLLLWMSHPAWPSMVWQTYDYYLDPTAAYFGCKKACEPIHIQWNPTDDSVEVVNYNAKDQTGLTAKAQILNMDGSVQWEKEAEVDSHEDTTIKCIGLQFPQTLSAVHFIKLTLTGGGKVLSENFYWRGLEDGNYQALNSLPKAQLTNSTSVSRNGGNWILKTKLQNNSKTPALMIRLKVVGKKSGERMLPVFFSDNFFALMPGDSKVVTIKLKDEDTRGEKPIVDISGFNL